MTFDIIPLDGTLDLIINVANSYHLISPTTILKLPLLYQWWNVLSETIASYGFNSPQSISVLKAIADCSGLDFDITTLSEEDVAIVLNAIASVNFPAKEKDDTTEGEGISLDEYKYQTINGLVSSELAIDLESALKIASTVNHKDLEGYLTARINFLNRDETNNKKEAETLMKELTDGSFWGNSTDGKDGFKEGVMRAMGMPSTEPAAKVADDEMPESVKKAFGL